MLISKLQALAFHGRSALGALRLLGLPWTRIPAGVSYLPLQSTLVNKPKDCQMNWQSSFYL